MNRSRVWAKASLRVLWAALVVALTLAAVNVLWDAREAPEYAEPSVVGVALALLATTPLLVARRWPAAVASVTSVAVFLLTIGEYSRWVAVLGPFLCLPWLARALPATRWGPIACFVLAVGVFALRNEPYVDPWGLALAIFLGPCLLLALAVEYLKGSTSTPLPTRMG